MTAAVSAALGLEGNLQVHKIRAEAVEHLLDHVVRPDAQNLVSNFGRQMPVAQVPGKARELIRILMPDFHDKLGSGLHLQQPPIVELQGVSIGHRNRLRKVEQDIFALIRDEANAAAVARVEIESERAGRLFLRPVSGGAMNASAMHR